MADRITPQVIPTDILITALHNIYLQNIIYMVGTRSKMQLVNLNPKPHGGKSVRDHIYHTIGVLIHPQQGSEHYKIIWFDSFNGSTYRQVKSRDKPAKKTKCILCKKYEAYNVLRHDRTGNCTWRQILQIPKTMYTWIDYTKIDVHFHLFHMVMYNSTNVYYPRFHLISYAYGNTYQTKPPPHAHPIHLYPCMHLHTKIFLPTLIHKILPDAHHKSLH